MPSTASRQPHSGCTHSGRTRGGRTRSVRTHSGHGGRIGRIIWAAGGVLILSASLAGCAGPTAGPTSAASPAATTTPSPTPTAVPEPTLAPQLSAAANLRYFDFLAREVLTAHPDAGGRSFIDALVAGGFDKAGMEVTYDRTNADLAADSIEFSVKFDGECLIGQTGPASHGYHSMVAHTLGSGACLVGRTRQIDW